MDTRALDQNAFGPTHFDPEEIDPEKMEAALDDLLERVRAGTERVEDLCRTMQRQEITGYAGNGEVTVRLLGTGRFTDISIDPDVLRRYQPEEICSFVLDAVNDGLRRLHETSRAAFEPLIAEAGG